MHPNREWLFERAYIQAERAIETEEIMRNIPRYQSIDEYFDSLIPADLDVVTDELTDNVSWEL